MKVILKPLHHQGQECIGIYFENYGSINTLIRKQAGAKWSQSNKCWYIPLSKQHYNKLFFALKGKAELEQAGLHTYLAEKKKNATPTNKSSMALKPAISFRLPSTTIKNIVAADKNLLQRSITIYKTGQDSHLPQGRSATLG